MAKHKITGLSASLLQPSAPDGGASPGFVPPPARPVVQTVKVPPDVYVRLKTVGARERRSSQDIILAALCSYLDQLSHPNT